jgi:ribose 5-phosphate isomerase B
MKHLVLFVCTGNICRSPMAAGLFNVRAKDLGEAQEFAAESAGTRGVEGAPASAYGIQMMAQRHVDIQAHRGRSVTREMMEQSSVVIVMTMSHREALAAEFSKFRSKIHMMSELNDRMYDINDPYGGSLDEYTFYAQELEKLIENGYEKIKTWARGNPSSRDS